MAIVLPFRYDLRAVKYFIKNVMFDPLETACKRSCCMSAEGELLKISYESLAGIVVMKLLVCPSS